MDTNHSLDWKARILNHERKLSTEIESSQKECQKQQLKLLETINKPYKKELSDLMGHLEDSHRKSREATMCVLGQLYNDYDNLRKQSTQNIKDLNHTLAKETREKEGRIQKLQETLSRAQDSLEKEKIQNTNFAAKQTDLEQQLKSTVDSLKSTLADHTEETKTRMKIEQKLAETKRLLDIALIKDSEILEKYKKIKEKLVHTETLLEQEKAGHSDTTKRASDLENTLRTTKEEFKKIKGKLITTEALLDQEKTGHSNTNNRANDLEKTLCTTRDDLEKSRAQYSEENKANKSLEQTLAKTKNSLQNSQKLYTQQCQKSKELESQLQSTRDQLQVSTTNHTEEETARKKLEKVYGKEILNSKELTTRLNTATDQLHKSKAAHTAETKTRKTLEKNLAKTKELLAVSLDKNERETEKCRGLQLKLEGVEKELGSTRNYLKSVKMEKKDAECKNERLEGKLVNLKTKLERVQGALEEAKSAIVELRESQVVRNGPTVNFFRDTRVKNSPPCVCDGSQTSILYLNVSEPIELESLGFLGPLDLDSIYDVTLQVNKMSPRGNKWVAVGQVKKKVQARRQQVFHVDFDEPIVLDDFATFNQNSFSNECGFYNISYSIKGPNIQSADILNGEDSVEVVEESEGVVFYTKWYHNHWAEIGFSKC